MKTVLTEEEYLKQWREAGLSPSAIDKIAPLVRRRNYIQLTPDPDGTQWSRWGGKPWLPASISPPADRFLCQIAIQEIPEGPAKERCPGGGFLFFFVHPKGRDKGQVLFLPEASETAPASSGKSTPIQLISRSDFLFPEYESDEFDELDLPNEPGNIYMDWEEDYLEGAFSQIQEGNCMLGGWTDASTVVGKQLKNRSDANWDVLLTLDPHENDAVTHSALGDIPFLTQRLFYFIQTEALQQANFGQIQTRYGAS